jgi:hypothetical protein
MTLEALNPWIIIFEKKKPSTLSDLLKPRTSKLTQDPLQRLAPDVLEPLKYFKEL